MSHIVNSSTYVFVVLICFLSLIKAVAQDCLPGIHTSELDGDSGFIINGIDPADNSGWSVRNAGDINGDTIDDIIIGAYWADPNGNDKFGEVYVVFGTTAGIPASLDLTSLDGINGFKIDGIDSWTGRAVSDAGDINNDGIDDLMFNAIFADPHGGGSSENTGSVYIIYGRSTGFSATFDLNTLDGNTGFVINGVDSGDLTGISLSNAGDINDDTIDDIIIGAESASPNTNENAGRSYVLFGQSLGFPAVFELSDLNGVNGFAIHGINIDDASGSSVANSGDINGDGIDDVMIGATDTDQNGDNSGQVYVIFGSGTPFPPSIELSDLNGTNGFVINGEDSGDYLGEAIASIGDINNDGLEDIAVSARQSSPRKVYVIFGTTTPFSSTFELTSLNGANGFVIEGLSVLSINNAQDFNDDGINDFTMGVPYGVTSQRGGYVVFGNSEPWPERLRISDINHFRIIEDGIQQNLGYDVDGTGDFNGDGVSDIIIGAPAVFERDEINGLTGVSYVVFGGDYCSMPLTTGYPQAIDETDSGFSLVVNGPETGIIHYSIFPGDFSGTSDYDDIRNGVGAVANGNFLMDIENADIQEIISSLAIDTTYDVYLFLEDGVGNQGQIYFIDNVTTLCPYTVPCEERDALIALYNATDGANWTTNTNWLTEDPVDTWFGVTVSGGHVTEVEFPFSGNNLNGTLPIELGSLNFLEKFSIPANSGLIGTIPNELFTNVGLVEIDLSDNGFMGNIPTNISNLVALRFLELDTNNFSGTIPTGIYTLTNLEVLNLYGNNISGPISTDIQNLKQLTDLVLGDNPIGGTIPIEIGDLINLTRLDLYRAGLTGAIPIEIGNLTNLISLQLALNELSGSIPASIGNLTQLTSLYLSSNNLTGAIPASLGNLTNVRLFLLGTNELTGSIPPELGGLINVESFYLYNNNLSGSIPPELGGLTSVTQLYLSNNQLDGSIPTSLATLPKVEDIFFHDNNLSGSFPDFTQAPNLNFRIFMYGNAFQFGDFENQWNAYQSQLFSFDDSPQDNVSLEQTINDFVGSDITLTTTVSGSQNNYQWYRNGVLIPGATNQNLVLNNVQLADAGDYYSMITSDIVTDLTLRRNDIHLIISIPPDTENPTASNPIAIMVQCAADVPVPDVLVVIDEADNNGTPVVAFVNDVSDGNSNPEVLTRTYSVTDAAGNSIDVTQTITINDTTNPTASIPSPIMVSCIADIPVPNISVVVDAADNCSTPPTVAFVGDSPLVGSNPGTIIRTYSITDAVENSMDITQIITINDTTNPTASSPSPIMVACIDDIPLPNISVVVDAADNCGTTPTVAFVSDSDIIGSNPSTIIRTYSVTDAAENSIEVTQTITIEDNTDPVISCLPDIIQNIDFDLSTAIVTYNAPLGTDNCSSTTSQIAGLPSGSEFPVGTTINTFAVTDAAGNTATCSFNVVINNNTCDIEAGEDEDILQGQEIQLNAITSDPGTLVWSPSTGLSSTSIANPIANPRETTTYTILFTSDQGCIAEDTITVFVEQLPEDETKYGFSPDGDGINEYWEIDQIDKYPNNRVSIYNRWGDLVFEVNGYNNTSKAFIGIANRKRSLGGDELPEGTYFFDIRIEGTHNLKKLTGFLVLKR